MRSNPFVDREAAARKIAAAWEAWLETGEHWTTCIGYSEGQWCCICDSGDYDGAYTGKQAKLIELALDALEAE